MIDLFIISLTFLVGVSGMRLLHVAKSGQNSPYKTHKRSIIVMMIVIVICETSSVYAAFLKNSSVFTNALLQFFFQFILEMAPAVAYIFVANTEDCLTCFNRFSTRYSGF